MPIKSSEMPCIDYIEMPCIGFAESTISAKLIFDFDGVNDTPNKDKNRKRRVPEGSPSSPLMRNITASEN